jgi:hypothetical protein
MFLAEGVGFLDMGIAEDVRNNMLNKYEKLWQKSRASGGGLSDGGASQVRRPSALLHCVIVKLVTIWRAGIRLTFLCMAGPVVHQGGTA